MLHRLARHPVDTLKIDRSFIRDLTSTSSTAVVAALLQTGIGLGTLAQGSFFSRPVPAEELGSLLECRTLLGHAFA